MQALSVEELLNYCQEETDRWRDWFKKNPASLELASDIAGGKNVRDVVLHIFVVQQRYAERLLALPVTEFGAFAAKSSDELFALADSSARDLRKFATQASSADWDGILTFPTRSAGDLTASRRKIFVHTLLHGVRHWAQLASFLRQQGFKQDWMHDLIVSSAMK